MKQETNNEMDLLLRRLGRHDDAAVPEDHLDADELSAYAENALPAAARARYTGHLAECSRCRSLIAQLSSSAGVVATTDNAAVPEPSGFRKFLASLFTPMVLRYAAPALGLIVVAAIGFVVLRRNQPEAYVARNTAADTHQQPVASPAASSGVVFSVSNPSPSPGRVDEEKKEKTAPAQPAGPPNMPPSVTSVEAQVSQDKAVAQPKPEEQTASANAPPPVKSEPTATPEQSPRAAETEAAKNEVKVQPVAGSQARKLRGAQRDDKDSLARAKKPADAASAPASGEGAQLQIGSVDDATSNTRTVAGRRFRQQSGVWVDTAYDSSKDAVTLSRGSEQYRALVADEPAIKTIADQLEGEIIVVWKGHTYRIR
ncbi:MAG TPA: zf-HC2 domain-containing protein [Pyrinomonadaceae bacterium]|nr:zf-HC2 domain-containing protein [Pyrinomonadaceae bacterium]